MTTDTTSGRTYDSEEVFLASQTVGGVTFAQTLQEAREELFRAAVWEIDPRFGLVDRRGTAHPLFKDGDGLIEAVRGEMVAPVADSDIAGVFKPTTEDTDVAITSVWWDPVDIAAMGGIDVRIRGWAIGNALATVPHHVTFAQGYSDEIVDEIDFDVAVQPDGTIGTARNDSDGTPVGHEYGAPGTARDVDEHEIRVVSQALTDGEPDPAGTDGYRETVWIRTGHGDPWTLVGTADYTGDPKWITRTHPARIGFGRGMYEGCELRNPFTDELLVKMDPSDYVPGESTFVGRVCGTTFHVSDEALVVPGGFPAFVLSCYSGWLEAPTVPDPGTGSFSFATRMIVQAEYGSYQLTRFIGKGAYIPSTTFEAGWTLSWLDYPTDQGLGFLISDGTHTLALPGLPITPLVPFNLAVVWNTTANTLRAWVDGVEHTATYINPAGSPATPADIGDITSSDPLQMVPFVPTGGGVATNMSIAVGRTAIWNTALSPAEATLLTTP